MVLLERDGPLAALEGAYKKAMEGFGSVIAVTGEAGIGKTALLERFAHDHLDDSRVLWGNCDDLAIPRPLGPFRDMALSGPVTEALDGEQHRFHSLLLESLDDEMAIELSWDPETESRFERWSDLAGRYMPDVECRLEGEGPSRTLHLRGPAPFLDGVAAQVERSLTG